MATKITVLTINGVTYSITAADPPDQADFPAWSRTIAHEIADVLQAAPALGTGALADVTKNTAAIAKLNAEPYIQADVLTTGALTIAAGKGVEVTGTFPVAYSQPPTVVATLASQPGGSGSLTVRTRSQTTTGFVLQVWNLGTTSVTVNSVDVDWIAAGPR